MAKAKKNKDVTPGVSLKKRYKPGDAYKLRQRLWRAVDSAERLLYADGISFDEQIRAVHALVQAAGAYAKILETTELQEQIDALKEELETLRESPALRKVV